MARKLSLSKILSDLRAKFTPRQIQNRTGVPAKTQADIIAGRTSGATYDAPLRASRKRGDQNKSPDAKLPRLPEAEDVVELKRLKTSPSRYAPGSPQHTFTTNYHRDLQAAKKAAKRRGEKFTVAQFDEAVMALRRERRRLNGTYDQSADGALARYLYLVGIGDRPMAVES